jgi:hypothetical protein
MRHGEIRTGYVRVFARVLSAMNSVSELLDAPGPATDSTVYEGKGWSARSSPNEPVIQPLYDSVESSWSGALRSGAQVGRSYSPYSRAGSFSCKSLFNRVLNSLARGLYLVLQPPCEAVRPMRSLP